jgi:prepilin-type N-terminal cleavage/methylation domain-containing protein
VIRRGISLVEILVSLVILGVVVGIAMVEFQYQNRNWKTESERAAASMMAKGTLDALTLGARSTGGGLPASSAGMMVWGAGEERVTFVMNKTGWVDNVSGYVYDPKTASLEIAVDSASKFEDTGYVRLGLNAPAGKGSSGPALYPQTFVLGIKGRVSGGGCAVDSLVLDATPFLDSLWNLAGDIQVPAGQQVYGYDSIRYRKSQDTLYLRQDQSPEMVYAVGVDSLHIQYHHPAAGWLDSLSSVAPANVIDKVWIRLVTRTLTVDNKLLAQNPASGGYYRCALETDVSVRNSNLVNR